MIRRYKGLAASYQLRNVGVPKWIEQFIRAAGETVYMHQSLGIIPDVIAGCYRAEKGMRGAEVLSELSRLHQESFDDQKQARLQWELSDPLWLTMTMRGLRKHIRDLD